MRAVLVVICAAVMATLCGGTNAERMEDQVFFILGVEAIGIEGVEKKTRLDYRDSGEDSVEYHHPQIGRRRNITGAILLGLSFLAVWQGVNELVLRRRYVCTWILWGVGFLGIWCGLLNVFGYPITVIWRGFGG